MTFEDFAKLHNREKVIGKKFTTIGKWWLSLDDRQRRQYDGVTFAPGRNPPGKWNLWTGFACEPKPRPSGGGSMLPYLDHLRENVCRGNTEHYKYIIGWMATCVQRPDSPAETSIVLRGKEGTGKGVAIEQFGKLFGPHFLRVTQARHLTGNFNAHLQNVVVLYGNEAFFAGDKQHEGALKALITERTLTIEPKGINPYQVPTCLHIMLSSNEAWIIPAGSDARRWFVLDVGDDHMQDHTYFANITRNMESGGREQLLHYLMNLKVEPDGDEIGHRRTVIAGTAENEEREDDGIPWVFDIRKVPKTEALADQQQRSRRGIDALVEHLAHEGALFDALQGKPWVARTLTNGAHPRAFYDEAQHRFSDLKRIAWPVALNELKGRWGCTQYRTGQMRGIAFPALKELRAKCDEKFGPQQWDDAQEWLDQSGSSHEGI
jgi:hypothetical protein